MKTAKCYRLRDRNPDFNWPPHGLEEAPFTSPMERTLTRFSKRFGVVLRVEDDYVVTENDVKVARIEHGEYEYDDLLFL